MVHGPEATLHSLCCDYVTCTAKEKESSERLHYRGSMLFRVQADCGNKSKPWSMKGFSGYQCGSVQVGTRGEEVIVRLSSDSANNAWKQVVHEAENVSRFDLEATIAFGDKVSRRIDRYRSCARRDSTRWRDKRRVRWVQEHHGGYTLYLGDRKSNVFGRIYDKGSESKLDQHAGCIRFEAQFQKKLARFIAKECCELSSPKLRFAAYLQQFFSGRGIHLEVPYTDGATYCCSRPRSDADKNLEWLAKAVQPCVRRLIDCGRGEEVLIALGLVDGPQSSI